MVQKKLSLYSLLVLLLSINVVVNPGVANAAKIANGVACVKAKATTKVGGKTYVCSKNPFVKPTKLTWTLRQCLTANNLRKDALEQYETWKDLAKLAGPEGDAVLADLQKSITDLENTMKNEVCKRGA